MRILFVTPYPIEGSSSRLRVWQYVPRLRALGHDVRVASFLSGSEYARFYRPGGWLWKIGVISKGFGRRLALLPEVRAADVVVVHRGAALVGPPLLERLYRRLNSRMVYDFDDALFIAHTSTAHRRLVFLKFPEKTATRIRLSRLVLAGNRFLADYARRINPNVNVVPTVVEVPNEPKKHTGADPVVIGWIGSSTTAPFLEQIADPLRQIQARYGERVEIRIVGADPVPGIKADYRAWTLENELRELYGFDIGVMPLPDTEWARGKCGLKALQYMSVGLPVVCSPVGVNVEIVEPGVNGFLARDPREWVHFLSRLVEDFRLRQKMGEQGRSLVRQRYRVDRWATEVAHLLEKISTSGRRKAPATRPRKVVQVLTRMNIGGPAIQTVLLAAGLNSGRFRSLLVTGHLEPGEGDMGYFSEAHGVRPVFIPELGRSIRMLDDLRAFRRLFLLLREERPDLLHTHMAKAGTLGRLAGWLAGVPVRVHTYHGHVLDGYFSPVRSKLIAAAERTLAALSSSLVAISPAVRDDLVHRFRVASKSQIHVIPLGIELAPFLRASRERSTLRSELGLGRTTALVGTAGRMVPVKNQKVFLEAAGRIHRKQPHAHFLLVGEGPEKPALERLAADLGLTEVVHFVGWRRRMERVYPDLDVFVLTSENEGMPVVLIEAMACGVPVVATRVGGVPDLVTDGLHGFVTPPGDAHAVAVAIVELLSNPHRAREMAESGRRHVRGRFTAERLVRDVEALYDGLLEKHAPIQPTTPGDPPRRITQTKDVFGQG